MEILYEDNHLLIINKATDWVVQGANADQLSLLEWGKDYLKEKYQKPGNVFLGVVSRLDAVVTGAVPFARTSKAAARLSEQLRDRSVKKLYWAIVDKPNLPSEDTLIHWLVRDGMDTVTTALDAPAPGAQKGEMKYRKIATCSLGDVLEVELITGRKHQIRAQLHAIGASIIGDRKYQSRMTFPEGIALHCRYLEFKHPTQDQKISVVAKIPDYWPMIRDR